MLTIAKYLDTNMDNGLLVRSCGAAKSRFSLDRRSARRFPSNRLHFAFSQGTDRVQHALTGFLTPHSQPAASTVREIMIYGRQAEASAKRGQCPTHGVRGKAVQIDDGVAGRRIASRHCRLPYFVGRVHAYRKHGAPMTGPAHHGNPAFSPWQSCARRPETRWAQRRYCNAAPFPARTRASVVGEDEIRPASARPVSWYAHF